MVWVMLATFAVYLGAHVVRMRQEGHLVLSTPKWISNRYVYLFVGVFILGMDFWAWNHATPMLLGIPVWIFYFVLLSALQTVGMVLLLRSSSSVFDEK